MGPGSSLEQDSIKGKRFRRKTCGRQISQTSDNVNPPIDIPGCRCGRKSLACTFLEFDATNGEERGFYEAGVDRYRSSLIGVAFAAVRFPQTRDEAFMDDEFDYHIRHRAYELWLESGRPDGKHQEFWEAAEKELKAKLKSDLNGAAEPAPTPPSPHG